LDDLQPSGPAVLEVWLVQSQAHKFLGFRLRKWVILPVKQPPGFPSGIAAEPALSGPDGVGSLAACVYDPTGGDALGGE